MSDLDRAHDAMAAAPDDALPRLRFYEALAGAELTLLLAGEPAPGADPVPALFDTGDGRFALAFDSDERLASFAEGPAAYAALPGRALLGMISGQGIGLGLNLGVAPSAFLMPAGAVDWLAGILAPAGPHRPLAVADLAERLRPPALDAALVAALGRKLGESAGPARFALLAGTDGGGGLAAHVLAVVGVPAGAEAPLAQAISEAMVFAGGEPSALDVMFLTDADPLVARMGRFALRFDPPPESDPAPGPPKPAPPGSDPARPPRLR